MVDILVIDDEAKLLQLLRHALEAEGFAVATAADGRAGLAACREAPPRLVVTDLFMPETDGLEVVRTLRREFPQIAIIAVSGNDSFGDAPMLHIALRLGARATFAKPFVVDELVAAVKEALASGAT